MELNDVQRRLVAATQLPGSQGGEATRAETYFLPPSDEPDSSAYLETLRDAASVGVAVDPGEERRVDVRFDLSKYDVVWVRRQIAGLLGETPQPHPRTETSVSVETDITATATHGYPRLGNAREETPELRRFRFRPDEWELVEHVAAAWGVSADQLLLTTVLDVLSLWGSMDGCSVMWCRWHEGDRKHNLALEWLVTDRAWPGRPGCEQVHSLRTTREGPTGYSHGQIEPVAVITDYLEARYAPAARPVACEVRQPNTAVEVALFNPHGNAPEIECCFGGQTSAETRDAFFEAIRLTVSALSDPSDLTFRRLARIPQNIAARTAAQAGPTALLEGDRLHEAVLQRCADTDGDALVHGDRRVSYDELGWMIRAICQRLRDVAPASDTPCFVVIEEDYGPELVAAAIAANAAGLAFVCLDPDWPQARKNSVLRRCGTSALVMSDSKDYDAINLPPVRKMLDDVLAAEVDPALPISGGLSDDVAYVIFTSGTTGEPKGVVVTHRNAMTTLQDVCARLDVDEDTIGLGVAPPGFDLWVFDVFGVLGRGGTLVIPSPEQRSVPHAWAELAQRENVTFWNSVPATFDLFIGALAEPLESLTRVMMSGDWIPLSLPNRARKVAPNADLWSFGGATEGSIWSICFAIPHYLDPSWPSIPYGRALAGQTMSVRDRGMSLRPVGVVGEICIGGEGVAQGYLKDPEQTREKFVWHEAERYYRTGDLGVLTSTGDLRIIGRMDNQVKIHGYRVELGDVQAMVETLPDVDASCVLAVTRPGDASDLALVAWVVGSDLDEARLREEAAARLPKYMVPNRFLPLDQLPLTANGKVDRTTLTSMAAARIEGLPTSADAASVDDDPLFSLCASLWDLPAEATPEMGFYEVGGDSLRAVQLLGALSNSSAFTISDENELLEELFAGTSLAEISASGVVQRSAS